MVFITQEQIEDLEDNYFYYSNNIEEAKEHFHMKWIKINNIATRLGLNKHGHCSLTHRQVKDLRNKYSYYIDHKEEAEEYFKMKWINITRKARLLKITSMETNRNCSMFLGCHVAERVLSYVFKDVQRMPNGNRGYDFKCKNGFKIDVKSCCLSKNNTYQFAINYNTIADYFLCIGFDNRENLNPQHIWLIKSNELMGYTFDGWRCLDEISTLTIKNNVENLTKYSKYELTDKLKETIKHCNKLR